MSDIQGDITSISPTTELEIINRKRTALQNLVKITTTLNRLQQGLQAVVLLGKTVADIPRAIIEKFTSLKEKLDGQPTDKLQNTLYSTDIRIQSDIRQVLDISRKSNDALSRQLGSEGDKLLDSINQNFFKFVDDFRKKGQTSVALRITLRARNVALKSIKLPVPEAIIENQLMVLEQREIECRKKINSDIEVLNTDIASLMSREDCPDDLKQKLGLIARNLQLNKEHIAAGKQIEDMPIIYESIEVSATPELVQQVEKESQPDEVVVLETPQEQKVKRGFGSRLWEWLRSPMSVRWKDINKYK